MIDPQVVLQLRALNEGLVAQLALVIFHARVRLHVPVERLLGRVPALAETARIRLLSGMDAAMLPQRPVRREGLLAEIAGERALVRVAADVNLEHGQGVEGLSARLAVVIAAPVVRSHVTPQVLPQVVQAQEFLATCIAGRLLLLRVVHHALGLFHVPVQVVLPCEFLAALRANEVGVIYQVLLEHCLVRALGRTFGALEQLRAVVHIGQVFVRPNVGVELPRAEIAFDVPFLETKIKLELLMGGND